MINEIKNHIINDKLDKALSLLSQINEVNSKDILNLKGRHKNIKDNWENKGLLSFEDYKIELNRIRNAIVNIIFDLDNNIIQGIKSHNVDSYSLWQEYITLAEEKLKNVIQVENEKITERLNQDQNEVKEDDIFIEIGHSRNDLVNSIILNRKKAINWSKEVSFRDLNSPKLTSQIFVHLDFYLTPKRVHTSNQEHRQSLTETIELINRHLLILGGPGAGKTTLLKYIYSSELIKPTERISISTPLVFRFRDFDYSNKSSANINGFLFKYLAREFNLNIKTIKPNDLTSHQYSDLLKQMLFSLLDSFNFLILFDGFDEIPDNEIKNEIAKNLTELALALNSTKFILTSRPGEFDYQLENSSTFEIAPLTEKQITKFIYKWLDNDKTKSKELFDKIKNSPYFDTTLRPLNLAHLCALYERNGDIPDRPKSVYRKIIYLLLEEWNAQRQVKKSSKYSKFTNERKLDFLSNLAFYLTTEIRKTSFDRRELTGFYNSICENYDLPKHESVLVVDELESHNGIFIQGGTDTFEFSHKSLQEYLTAEYVINLGSIPENESLLFTIPQELAIAVSLSTNSSIYFSTLVLNRLKRSFFEKEFLVPFFKRIALEKPDFSPDPFLAIAFNNLYYELVYNEQRAGYRSLIEDHVLKYLEKDNFVKAFTKLLNYYSIPDIKIDPSKDLHERKYTLIKKKDFKGLINFKTPDVIRVNQKILDIMKTAANNV